jgi:ribose 5-phosphate isomerase A
VIIVIDSSKWVGRLGRFPLPVEVLPFAGAWVARALTDLAGTPTRRLTADGAVFHTDQGNLIFDMAFTVIEDPERLAASLARVPGVIEHGLFLDQIDTVFIGRPDGVEVVGR